MRQLRLAPLFFSVLLAGPVWGQANSNAISAEAVLGAQKLIGLEFSEPKIKLMLPGLQEQLDQTSVKPGFS